MASRWSTEAPDETVGFVGRGGTGGEYDLDVSGSAYEPYRGDTPLFPMTPTAAWRLGECGLGTEQREFYRYMLLGFLLAVVLLVTQQYVIARCPLRGWYCRCASGIHLGLW